MESVLQQRFFRLLSEYSQRTVSVSELAEAIEELATHVANFSINERHYKIFCVNVKYGIQYGFRIFYLIALQNEENYEREESCSA